MLSCSHNQLKEQLSNEATTRDGLMAKATSLQAQLVEEEEGRRNTHVSVMRLEAQVRLGATTNSNVFRANSSRCVHASDCLPMANARTVLLLGLAGEES